MDLEIVILDIDITNYLKKNTRKLRINFTTKVINSLKLI
jgi:hypothetical protein